MKPTCWLTVNYAVKRGQHSTYVSMQSRLNIEFPSQVTPSCNERFMRITAKPDGMWHVFSAI